MSNKLIAIIAAMASILARIRSTPSASINAARFVLRQKWSRGQVEALLRLCGRYSLAVLQAQA